MSIDLSKLGLRRPPERRQGCCYRRATNCRKDKCSCVCEPCRKNQKAK